MAQVTPIDQFCNGRLGLPELLTQIDKTFSKGDSSEQSALLDSWRKNEQKKVLDRRVYNLIDEKLEAAYSKTRLDAPAEDKTVIASSAAGLRPGYVLNGRFILEEVLGQGGMGVVYRATDLRRKEAQDRDPNVAIKVLSDDFRHHPDSFRALQREARKAQSLAHPNIIAVYDFDREGSLIYLTMEYLSGTPLDKQMKSRKGPRPVAQVLPIVKAIAAALAFAHENGIVHSDLKPANIFITDNGRVKVIDFGIARAVKHPDAPPGEREVTVFDAGRLRALTPAYASIEMIEGQPPDARDDIFALGCITYELITGRHPYGRTMATDARDEGIVPKKPRQLSSRQWRALAGTLSLIRQNRTPTAQQFINEFAGSPRKLPLAAILGGGAAAAMLVGLTMLYFIGEVSFGSHGPEVARPGSEPSAAEAERRAAEQAKQQASQLAAAEASKRDAERQAAEASRRETERQAAAAARQETERQAAAETARKETERQTAAEAARKEAERQAAAETARKETERQATAEATRKEAERQAAAETARKEAERQAAGEAARKEAERQAAAETARKEADRQAAADVSRKEAEQQAVAETARKAAERQAVETAGSDLERQGAEATRKEAERKAAEATQSEAKRKAAEAAQREAERKAAEAAQSEAKRKAAEAAQLEAERKAEDAARRETQRQAADAAREQSARDAKSGEQVAVLNVPKLSEASLMGSWCSGPIKIRLSSTEWRFQPTNGSETVLPVTQYRVSDGKIIVYSKDTQNRDMITEFGGVGGDQMTQIRGKFLSSDSWSTYDRVFKKC
jgi:serine/threonine protein kinase